MPGIRGFSIAALILIANVELANVHGMPTNTDLNDRPIVAILSQKAYPDMLPPGIKAASYIAASYVKYIESAGARVVPVTTTMSSQEVEEIFNSVNGVLFPGGGASVFDSEYATHAKRFVTLATEANKRGDFFPVWGTCLGFEALACIVAEEDVLSSTNAVDIAIPLNFSSDARSSEMLRDAPDELMKKLSTEGLTYNHHHKGVTPETFYRTRALNDMFRVLSHNNDVDGKTFISTMEGELYRVRNHLKPRHFPPIY